MKNTFRLLGIIPVITVIGFAILFASCNNPFDTSADQPPFGYGRVTLNITSGETERSTAFPDINFNLFTFTYTFFKDGGNGTGDLKTPDSGTTFTLPNGKYTKVEVKVYTDNSLTTQVASGSSSGDFTVGGSSTPEVAVKLTPTAPNSGTGTFAYNITYPDGADISVSLDSWPSLTNAYTDSAAGSNGSKTGTKTGLAAGSYVLKVSITDNVNNKYAGFVKAVHIYASMTTTFTYTFTANDLISKSTYGFSLHKDNETAALTQHQFDSAEDTSYTVDAQNTLTVTVKNTGNQATGELDIKLSGGNTSNFELSKAKTSDLATSTATDTFTVKPKTGLAFESYSETVTVSNTANTFSKVFTVNFDVNDPTVPKYEISLTPSGDFTGMIYKTATLPKLTVTVKNTGNKPTGALNIALSGDDSSSFTLSKSSTGDLAANAEETFDVTPKSTPALAVKAYTAKVTVSGGNGITKDINLNFTVTAKNIADSSITVEPTSITAVYTGSPITPSFSLKDGSDALTKDTDYTVVDKLNTNVNDNATVLVKGKGNYDIDTSRDISFKITAPFSLLDSNDVALGATVAFDDATAGYTSAPTAKTIKVKNNNTTAISNITAALSGAASSNFTITSSPITNIAGGASGTFTVQPKTGLAANDYQETVTVSGVGTYTDTFTVSFKVTAAPTVTGVTVSPSTASVAKGGTQQFSASVTGTGNPATTVTWTVEGGITGTSITDGLLTVAADETATTLTVTATSTVTTSVSGTATVTVTGGGGSDPTGLLIKVAGEEKEVEVTAVKGTITYLTGNTGFKYEATPTSNDGYGNEFPKFKVDLGTGKKLIDYEKLNITYQGISGDINGKTLYLQAQTAEPTGYFNISTSNVASISSITGTTSKTDSFNLEGTKVVTIASQEVWFVINLHAKSADGDIPTSFQISNIELIERETPFVPVKVSTAISLRAPVDGETPVASVTGTGYSGTVEWKDSSNVTLSGNFVSGTVYTATITLTKINAAYTFDGVAADEFTLSGAANVSNPAGNASDTTLVVTATFPATASAIPDKPMTFAAGEVKGSNGSAVIESDGNGFTYTTTQGSQYSHAYFKVKFADDITLSSYSKISYKVTSSGTDATYKSFFISAFAAEPDSSPIDAANRIGVKNGWEDAGFGNADQEYARTVDINPTLPTGTDLNEVWIAFNSAANPGLVFKVTDIKFHN